MKPKTMKMLRYSLALGTVIFLSACALSQHPVHFVQQSDTALETLPAQFRGDLPCADCSGIRYELSIFPEHDYTLQTHYLGTSGQASVHFETGHWQIGGDGSKLELVPDNGGPTSFWHIVNANLLIMLDTNGNAIVSELDYSLHRTGRPKSASLENTHWQLVRVAGSTIGKEHFVRQPRLIMHADSGRISGATGCNLLLGQYSHDKTSLSFSKLGSTRMACPGPSMQTESAMTQALNATKRYRILADHLIVYDRNGQPLATFRATATQ